MAEQRTPSPPRQVATTGFEVYEENDLLEEETYSFYSSESFYPVKIGEIFESRYQVLGKLGFGSVSTAWLCRDLVNHKYVTLKVFVTNHRQARNENKVYRHLKSIKTTHPGARGVRSMLDNFQIPGRTGVHECLVHDPLSLTLADLRIMSDNEKVTTDILKPMVRYLLMVLDFLHTEARVVHTDIQDGNVMLGSDDDIIFHNFEAEERDEPSGRKIDGERIIYMSRDVHIPDDSSRAVLCDFGDAEFEKEEYTKEVMPDLYRAPEIVLGIAWNEKIDIWSVVLMVWSLFEGKHLFTERLPTRADSTPAHIARMIALMGAPPKELLNGATAKIFFDEKGKFTPAIESEQTSREGRRKSRRRRERGLPSVHPEDAAMAATES